MDPYAVLGVDRNASADEIRQAYVALARSTHPDVRGDDPDAAEQMRRINLAWETLSDTAARAAIDRQLKHRPHPGFANAGSADAPRPSSADDDRAEHAWDDDRAWDDDLGFGQHDHDVDDQAITAGELPAWMRLGAPAAFILGIFAVIFGVMVGGFLLVRLGLMTLGFSVVLFVLSPFVVLVRSRGRPLR